MTSIYDCLQRAMDAGDLDKAHGRAAQGHFDQLVARYETIMPRAQAEASAAADLKEATRKAARSRFHAVVNQLQAMRRLRAVIDDAPDPALALRNLIEHREDSGSTAESVRSIREALEAQIRYDLRSVLDRHQINTFGNVTEKAGFENIVRELHGEQTGDASAAQLAEAVRIAQRRQRQYFNALGGDIGELADYGVPHSHSAEALMQATFPVWAEKIRPLLAWDKITDHATGHPFAASAAELPPPAAVNAFLRDVYDSITTRGWDDRTPSLRGGGKALYNTRADHRILHFRDGSAWLDYNRSFGTADPFSAMLNGLNGVARDVALMRVLGPNPRASLDFAIQLAEKRAAEAGDAAMAAAVQKEGGRARVDLGITTGASNIPESVFWARLGRTVRSYNISTSLGGAILSASTDFVTSSAAAKMIGMNPRNVLSRTVDLMANRMSRDEAARMGFVAESLADAMAGTARFQGPMMGASSIADRLSNFVLRAQGLTFLTDCHRLAFQGEMAAELASLAARGFDELTPEMRTLFQRRGITASDWDHLREPSGRFRSDDGTADYISPLHWLEHQTTMSRPEAEGLALRLQGVFQEQVEMAVPTASISAAGRLTQGAPAGSFVGELTRSGLQFKSYGLSVFFGQYRRAMMQGSIGGIAGYALTMLTGLTLMGALTIQLKEIAKGNSPRPMTDLKFWEAAVLQGGGFGIFGDFFAAEKNRIGGGIGETLAGPSVGLVTDVGRLAKGRDVANFVRYHTPVGSSLWYAKLAFSRLAVDPLQRVLDPDAQKSFDTYTRRQMKEFGTRSWWRRGELLPSGMPDLSNAMGSAP